MLDLLNQHSRRLSHESFHRVTGRVGQVTGLRIVAEGLPLPVGSLCRIVGNDTPEVSAQVVGVRGDQSILIALHEPWGIRAGDPVCSDTVVQMVAVGSNMLGAVLDGLGRPIGGRTSFTVETHYPVYSAAPKALTREPVNEILATGIRSIDAMHTLGGGQRIGVFAGTGVGKSVLMGMIARFTNADVIVAALVGERGREVGDFLRKDLGEEGLSRSVLVVSTSDESPVLRVRAGFVATAVAEFFRDRGAKVLLMMDSTTRVAMAQRQIGLSAGEPPTTKGYPPSVFDLLPKLMERAGRTSTGSITGLYTVLVEGDDLNEPISDAVRGILDGHLWLSRGLANRGHYPAIAPLESISRVMTDVIDEEHRRAAMVVRGVLAVWADIEDLVNVGAYVPGVNADFDVAVRVKPVLDEFLQQGMNEKASYSDTRERLLRVAGEIESMRQQGSIRKEPGGGSQASSSGTPAR
ncbi:MAG: FliI/YscN family ATPase [Planctomycetota bacterium]